MKAAIALVSILMLSSQTSAEEARQVRQGQPVAVTSDLAYLLFREDPRQGPGDFEYVLARELQKTILPLDHVAAPPQFDAQASLIRTDARYPYVNDAGQKSYLLAVPPGVYSIVAVTYKRMPAIGTCLCMGTVRFEARAGMLNDLGYLLGAIEDKPSRLPELASYTGSLDWTHTTPALALMTVRPSTDEMGAPSSLRTLPRTRAKYAAAGKFPNYFRTMINRVPPIAGVLAYEGDRAINPQVPER